MQQSLISLIRLTNPQGMKGSSIFLHKIVYFAKKQYTHETKKSKYIQIALAHNMTACSKSDLVFHFERTRLEAFVFQSQGEKIKSTSIATRHYLLVIRTTNIVVE